MEVLAVLHHILPGHNGADGGGIGGGAADALFLQGPDKGGLGVPGRGLGELLVGLGGRALELLALLQVGQRRGDLVGLLVLALFIDRQEAGELHLGPAGLEDITGALHLDAHAVIDGGGHLAGQEPAPDELIQAELLGGQVLLDGLGGELHVGGTDGFVGVLGSRLGLEPAGSGGQILLTVPGGHEGAGGGDGLLGDAQGVGTHVGDQTHGAFPFDVHAFVELLGDGHGPAGTHVQLPAGLLLEGAGDERRSGGTAFVLALDVADGEGRVSDALQNLIHLLLGLKLHLLFPAPELGLEGSKVGGNAVKGGLQGPVFLRHKGPDLGLPLGHQSCGHGLDAAGGQAPADLLPQQGGQLIAHDPVQDAAGLLGVHQVLVDLPGSSNALGNDLFRDFVEGDPAGLGVRQIQQLLQVPGNGFSFPVRVGCQVHLLAGVGGVLQRSDGLLLSFDGLVVRLEAVFQIHAHLALGQVADMPHGGQHLVAGPQIFSDGLCLGR